MNLLARAIDKWFKSEDGKKSTEGITHGRYLRNRLELAFIAGWDARDEIKDLLLTKIKVHAVIKTLDWMITDMQKRFDSERSCFGQEVTGGYSPQLTKAIELLEELRKEQK